MGTKGRKLGEVQREVIVLANGLEHSPHNHALRLAINAFLDAHEKETAKAFGMGLLAGAVGMIALVLAGAGLGT